MVPYPAKVRFQQPSGIFFVIIWRLLKIKVFIYMKCNVCNEDKELNQYQTYWHSTQQKMRTRKQCNQCYYNIRLRNKNPEKYYQNNPDYHKCNTCKDWKLIKEFYTTNDKIYSHRCRVCTK